MPLACKVASLQTLEEAEQMQSNPGLERETCWQPALAQDGPRHGCQQDLASFKKKNSSANLCGEVSECITEFN